MKCSLVLILLMVLGVSAQPDPVEFAQLRLERIEDSIKIYPDVTRFKEERLRLQMFIANQKKTIAKSLKATHAYVNHLIETDSTDLDFTKEELYRLRGDFRLFEDQNYRGAIEDYIKILSDQPLKRRFVYEQILQVLIYKNELAFNSQLLTPEEHEVLKNKIPLEASVFRQFVNYQSALEGNKQQLIEFPDGYISAQRVVFFQRVYEWAQYYHSIGAFQNEFEILDSLSQFTVRNELTNTYDFENYSDVFQLLARVYTSQELRNEEQFLQQLYLFIGSPIGQLQAVDTDLWNQFKAIDHKNETWHFINAIFHLRKAYYASYDGISNNEKLNAIATARKSLSQIETILRFQTNAYTLYMYYYLKAVLLYEFDGEVRKAFENINNALAVNKRDFFVFEYRQRMLRLYNNQPDYSGMTDQEKKDEMKSNALSQHEYSTQIEEKRLTLELVFDFLELNKENQK